MSVDTASSLSETKRQAALASWKATGDDPVARSARTAAANKARGRVAEALAEIETLRGELRNALTELHQRVDAIEADKAA